MISQLVFGRTGHMSTRTLFGAAALGSVTQAEADQTLDLLLQYGVNHLDTAASYGDAEIRMGPWMPAHRKLFFLASKTEQRRYAEAKESIQRSLERMKTDQLDLIQLHSMGDPTEWEIAMGPGGALEACIEARQQGLVRFIGITGHGLQIASLHLRALEQFDFDSVLLPYNYPLMQNPQYAAEFEALNQVCQARNIAFQTIKSLCRAPWGEQARTRATWYEPLENQADIDLAVGFVFARPTFFLNTTGDIHILPRILDAASRYTTPPSEMEMKELVARARLEPLFA